MRFANVRVSACGALLLWACLPPGTGGGGDQRGEGGVAGGEASGGHSSGGSRSRPGVPGSPCDAGADCDSGVCVELDGARFCVAECGGDRDCPDGFGCRMGLCLPEMSPGGGGSAGAGGAGGRDGAGGAGGSDAVGGAVGVGGAAGGEPGEGGGPGDGCDGIDCGAHGVCEAGECVCADGFIGRRCEEPPLMGRDAVDACQDFLRCTDRCEADAQCLGRCDRPFPAGTAVVDRIVLCAMDQGCVEEEEVDRQCLATRCAAELVGCFGERPEPRGNVSCMHTNLCFSSCGEGNVPCVDDCIAAAAPQSYRLLEAMQACSQQAGCADFACVRETCPDAYFACRRDSTGLNNCIQISDCWFNCRDEEATCPWECMYSGTFDAQMILESLLICMEDNRCVDPNRCAPCDLQVIACFAD